MLAVSWSFVSISFLLLVKGVPVVTGVGCHAGQLPPAVGADGPVNIGMKWVLNNNNPSSCSGKLTQFNVSYYNNDEGGVIYLSLWTLLETNQYSMVKESLRELKIKAPTRKKRNIPDLVPDIVVVLDQFVYAHNGSVVGVYSSNNHFPVLGMGNTQLCGTNNVNINENTTKITCDAEALNNENYILYVTAHIETVDCGSLANINNGYVSLLNDSTLYGSVAQYQCNVTGYILNGNEERFCSQDETWNGTEPFCELFNCTIPSIGNGMIQGNTFTYGSSISYTCNEGYTLTGDSVITCGSNMTWNGSAVCNPVNCSDPGTPINGSQTAEDGFIYQSIVLFNCNSGYDLIGSSSIECLSNSTWNTSVPVCDTVNCGDPGTPDNGEKNSTTYTYGTTIHFKCNSTVGYNLSTPYDSIKCLSNGSWSDTTPSCEQVTCDSLPPSLVNGYSNISNNTNVPYPYKTSVVYKCDKGFVLNGKNKVTCLVTGHWSEGPIECLKTMCEVPHIKNGKAYSENKSVEVGVVVKLSCNSSGKYQLNIEENAIECLSPGKWNYTSVPKCTKISSSMSTIHLSSSSTFSSTDKQSTSSTTTYSHTNSIAPTTLTASLSVVNLNSSSHPIDTTTTTAISTQYSHLYSIPSISSHIIMKTVASTTETIIVASSLRDSISTSSSSSSPSLSNQVQSHSDGALSSTSYIVIGVLAGLLVLVLIVAVITALLLIKTKCRGKSKTFSFADNDYQSNAIEMTRNKQFTDLSGQEASTELEPSTISHAMAASSNSSGHYVDHDSTSAHYSLATAAGYSSVDHSTSSTRGDGQPRGTQVQQLASDGEDASANHTLSTGVPALDTTQDCGDKLSYDYIDVPEDQKHSQLIEYATVRQSTNDDSVRVNTLRMATSNSTSVEVDDIPTDTNVSYVAHHNNDPHS